MRKIFAMAGSLCRRSREEIFFPFLPSAHSPVERYYEAHQAPVAHIMPSNSNYGSMKLAFPQAKKSVGRDELYTEPLQPQTYRPATTTIAPPPPADRSASPPVPALLKKIRLANGESVTEKHEWEDYEEKEKNDGHKVSKDFENLKIRENQGEDGTTVADPDKEKQDLLFRLSLLKRVSFASVKARGQSLQLRLFRLAGFGAKENGPG